MSPAYDFFDQYIYICQVLYDDKTFTSGARMALFFCCMTFCLRNFLQRKCFLTHWLQPFRMKSNKRICRHATLTPQEATNVDVAVVLALQQTRAEWRTRGRLGDAELAQASGVGDSESEQPGAATSGAGQDGRAASPRQRAPAVEDGGLEQPSIAAVEPWRIEGKESGRRSERTAACSAVQGTALVASLTLLPYMGPSGVLKAYNDLWYLRYVGTTFSSMWCLIGLGVPCLFVRSQIQHFYARLFSRIGMLAVTLLVIFYCHWMLFPDSQTGYQCFGSCQYLQSFCTLAFSFGLAETVICDRTFVGIEIVN